MQLTVEQLRYASITQLEEITGLFKQNFHAWSRDRRISSANLERLARIFGMTEYEVEEAFRLRRQDTATRKELQDQVDLAIAQAKPKQRQLTAV